MRNRLKLLADKITKISNFDTFKINEEVYIVFKDTVIGPYSYVRALYENLVLASNSNGVTANIDIVDIDGEITKLEYPESAELDTKLVWDAIITKINSSFVLSCVNTNSFEACGYLLLKDVYLCDLEFEAVEYGSKSYLRIRLKPLNSMGIAYSDGFWDYKHGKWLEAPVAIYNQSGR